MVRFDVAISPVEAFVYSPWSTVALIAVVAIAVVVLAVCLKRRKK